MRSLTRLPEALLHRLGYVIEWRGARAISARASLPWTFEMVAAHLMLRKSGVFYVSIGANNGIANDPIWPFVTKHGWRGIAIEPNPLVFPDLVNNYRPYPGVKCVNAAIGHNDGTAKFYTLETAARQNENHWSASQLGAFDRGIVERNARLFPQLEPKIIELTVETISWKSIVAAAGAERIDVLHIDTEGFDAEVISMIDFESVRPAIVQFEHVNLTKEDQEACTARLVAAGYLLARNNFDVLGYQWASIAA